MQVIEVPRPLLAHFLAMPESNQVALYFLVAKSEDGTDSRVYIGQTGEGTRFPRPISAGAGLAATKTSFV